MQQNGDRKLKFWRLAEISIQIYSEFGKGLSEERLKRSKPKAPWKETPAQLGQRFRSICNEIDNELNVEQLCKDFPERLQEVDDADEDCFKH